METSIFIPLSANHNDKIICLILCRSPFCCQNSSNLSKYGLHKTPEGHFVQEVHLFLSCMNLGQLSLSLACLTVAQGLFLVSSCEEIFISKPKQIFYF